MDRPVCFLAATYLTAALALSGCDDTATPGPTTTTGQTQASSATTSQSTAIQSTINQTAPAKATTAKSAPAKAITAKSTPAAGNSPRPQSKRRAQAPDGLPKLLFFPRLKTPADNALTQAKIDLGKVLFFDKRLGQDGKLACVRCHHEDKGWADGKALSGKADGTRNTRHTPTLLNVGYQRSWSWDGRANTLEAQVLAAWRGQMSGDPDAVAQALVAIDAYRAMFKAAYGDETIDAERIIRALASFVRSIRSGNAPWDRYQKGDKSSVSNSAVRGWEVFRVKAGCAACHTPPLFTDQRYHNVGVGYDKPDPDRGRFTVTQKERDRGAFKTPSLRSVVRHPPYLHDGSAKTLQQAVDYMLSGGHKNPNSDSGMIKIELTPEQRADLIAFIKALDGERPLFTRPQIP